MKEKFLISFLCVSFLFLCIICPVSAGGIFRNSGGNWYLDYENNGIKDITFHFGTAGDIPVTGDWDNDGISDVGVYRPSTGNWYLETAKTGVVNRAFHFGTAGDIPVTGDWNNDGISDVGVYRPSIGNWYLETAKTGVTYRAFHFGTAGDIPVTGDWDNDGISDVGVYRPSTGNWYLETAKTGVTYRAFHFGTAGDIPVTGDWDNDGISDVGVYRPSTGNWYLETTKTGVVNRSFHFGTTGDIPVIGDWNNDGISDAGVFRPSSGDWYLETTKTGVVNRTFHFGTNGDKPTALKLPPAQTIAPVANFIADVRSGTAPLTVMFTDQSTGIAPLTFAWDFTNDGVSDSTQQDPSFTYSTAGTYAVRLTVTNAAGNNTVIQTSYITVNPAPVAPTAAFSADVRSGYAPLTVTFIDSSTGSMPMTYSWNFGDGGTSSDQNPLHTYSETGTYTVTLRATNSLGTNQATKTGYITVIKGQSGSHAGIVLSFDDQSVNQWYAIRGMLQKYNAHATFYVSNFWSLGEDEINLLRILQADGNEIGFHGLYHTNAASYLQTHTVQQYLNYEIIPGISQMRAAGLEPSDFAYPFGSDAPAATEALQAYFGHIRGTDDFWDDRIYYTYGSDQAYISGIGIDESYGQSIDTIYAGITRAKDEDKVLSIYGHTPVQTVTGDCQTSYDRLDKILNYTSVNNLKFYTVRELT